MSNTQAPQSAPNPSSLTPAQSWARETLLRPDATARSLLLRAVVGVTQLHAAGQYPDAQFAVAGQHLGDQLYNAIIRDEAGIHFAAAVLFQAGATEAQRQPADIRDAVVGAALECVAALMNLARAEVKNLPDCTAAGREVLAKQLQSATPLLSTDPTPPRSEAS